MVSMHLSEEHCPSYPARRNVGQSLIQNCTAVLWSWPVANSSLLELHAGPLCAASLHFRSVSTPASPYKSHPSSRQGFALSLLHARQMPAAFLILSYQNATEKTLLYPLAYPVFCDAAPATFQLFLLYLCHPYWQDNLFFELKSSFSHWN